MRTFNTEGPVVAADHYHIPPLERIDLDEVLGLVHGKKYFVLHAPRQTGKTSALLALSDLLNSGGTGDYRCVYANVEAGQAARENVAEGMRAVLSQLALRASLTLHPARVESSLGFDQRCDHHTGEPVSRRRFARGHQHDDRPPRPGRQPDGAHHRVVEGNQPA